MKNLLKESYNLGVKAVFKAFDEEIKDLSQLHRMNAEYLINLIKKQFREELNDI